MKLGSLLGKVAKWFLKHPEVVQALTAAVLERKKPKA